MPSVAHSLLIELAQIAHRMQSRRVYQYRRLGSNRDPPLSWVCDFENMIYFMPDETFQPLGARIDVYETYRVQ